MIPIWEGNVTKIWDAVQFCRIIDNMFFWAQHCLKPKVAQYLSQWRLRYCPDTPNIHSRLEQDTETADMVHRIQDRLSSLGISPNEDIRTLVHQAVILQEVMRSTDEMEILDPKVDDEKENAPTITALNYSKEKLVKVIPSRPKQSGGETQHKINLTSTKILQQDYGSNSDIIDESTAQSSQTHTSLVIRSKSPSKCETTVVLLPEKSGPSRRSKQPEEPRG